MIGRRCGAGSEMKFNRASRAGNKETAKMFQLTPNCQNKRAMAGKLVDVEV